MNYLPDLVGHELRPPAAVSCVDRHIVEYATRMQANLQTLQSHIWLLYKESD